MAVLLVSLPAKKYFGAPLPLRYPKPFTNVPPKTTGDQIGGPVKVHPTNEGTLFCTELLVATGGKRGSRRSYQVPTASAVLMQSCVLKVTPPGSRAATVAKRKARDTYKRANVGFRTAVEYSV